MWSILQTLSFFPTLTTLLLHYYIRKQRLQSLLNIPYYYCLISLLCVINNRAIYRCYTVYIFYINIGSQIFYFIFILLKIILYTIYTHPKQYVNNIRELIIHSNCYQPVMDNSYDLLLLMSTGDTRIWSVVIIYILLLFWFFYFLFLHTL